MSDCGWRADLQHYALAVRELILSRHSAASLRKAYTDAVALDPGVEQAKQFGHARLLNVLRFDVKSEFRWVWPVVPHNGIFAEDPTNGCFDKRSFGLA